jgi:hypothetical protein
VFVERRITALALHAYFLWRNKEIAGNEIWPRAKETRQLSTVYDVFQLTSSVEGGECQIFDDADDDPFHFIRQENRAWQPPISLRDLCSTIPVTPDQQCSQIMEPSRSEDEKKADADRLRKMPMTIKDCSGKSPRNQ